jgi:hypothetical protein
MDQKVIKTKRKPTGAAAMGAGPGRPKGTPNKTTTLAKDAIAAAAAALGGEKRLAEWAGEDPQNERVFWGTIYPKLLPLTVDGGLTHTINWPVKPPPIGGR